jgi:amino acid transporter
MWPFSQRPQNKKSKIQVTLSLLCFSGMYLGPKRRGRFRLLLRYSNPLCIGTSQGVVFLMISATSSALGNVITVTYSASRVNQELAKEGVPLPFGNKFWASNWPTGKSPLPGLIVHLIPSVIIILGPPPSVAYPFILDVEGYPQQIINLFIVCGLFWLRWKKPNVNRPFKVWLPFALFFLAAAVFRKFPIFVAEIVVQLQSLVIIAPFLRPANGIGDTPPLPYYLYCLVGIAIMVFGVIYWAVWRIVLPKIFGYELVPTKVVLDDGTTVNVFSRKKVE